MVTYAAPALTSQSGRGDLTPDEVPWETIQDPLRDLQQLDAQAGDIGIDAFQSGDSPSPRITSDRMRQFRIRSNGAVK
ncbi:hypothetical protein C7B16_19765 [Escherichia sp. 20412-1]|nr:hypothetical protein C7B16_19765 [Escherichia sp. 20412-1]